MSELKLPNKKDELKKIKMLQHDNDTEIEKYLIAQFLSTSNEKESRRCVFTHPSNEDEYYKKYFDIAKSVFEKEDYKVVEETESFPYYTKSGFSEGESINKIRYKIVIVIE